MTSVDARANAVKVRHAFNALHSGTEGLSAFPSFLLEVINDEAWREVGRPGGGEPDRFEKFADWIVARPPTGLGAESLDQVRRLVVGTPAELPLRKALENRAAQGERTDLHPTSTNNISRSRATKQGTSRAYVLDRLERERPDLKERVDANELTPNQAAIEAGFRPRTFTLRADSAVSIAATLRRQLSEEVLCELVELLKKG